MGNHHGTFSNTRERVDSTGRRCEPFKVRVTGADKSRLPDDDQTRKLR
jgi:hypothetical protein